MGIYYSPDKGLVVNKLAASRAGEQKAKEDYATTYKPVWMDVWGNRQGDGYSGAKPYNYLQFEMSDGTHPQGPVASPSQDWVNAAKLNYDKDGGVIALNKATNLRNKASNEEIDEHNANAIVNTAYDTTVATLGKAEGGDYVNRRAGLRAITNVDDTVKKEIEAAFRAAYIEKHITKNKWKPELSLKPPYGDFDPKYYKDNYPDNAVGNAWERYEADDDVDIVERYGEVGFYANHYSTQGKAAGLRGNALEAAKEAEKYATKYEPKKTDAELQDIRNKQLGLDTTTQSSRLMKEGSAIAIEWEKAKKGDPYWKKQAKEKYPDIDATKPDEFLTLFRLSERPEDKEILEKAIGTEGGITELEDAFNQAVGAEALVETKKFGALAQDDLKETIAEMKKAKEKEQMLDLYKGLGGFSEIMDINKQLSNSILGDSGVGGILSQMGSTTETKEDLEKKLENITGVRNNVVYNWEKWFDNTLKTKYGIDYSEFEPLE